MMNACATKPDAQGAGGGIRTEEFVMTRQFNELPLLLYVLFLVSLSPYFPFSVLPYFPISVIFINGE